MKKGDSSPALRLSTTFSRGFVKVERIEQRPSSTQFLIFTLFGDCVLPRGGTIWTTNLLYLMELLGVSERATRSTLSRMARKGWVQASRHGRRSRYSLTPRGRSLLMQGKKRIFELPYTHWDGSWYLVIYSLPERSRKLRHELRKQLSWLGFGRLAPGSWISPHDRQAELEEILLELELQTYVELFCSRHLGHSSATELVERCWNLPELAAEYSRFVAKHRPAYESLKTKIESDQEPSPEVCFTHRFWVTHDFQPFPRKDPNLPTQLLPPNWIGLDARRLFENYRILLDQSASNFIDAIIGADSLP